LLLSMIDADYESFVAKPVKLALGDNNDYVRVCQGSSASIYS